MSPEAVAPPLARHRFQALGSACELLAVEHPREALQQGEAWIRQAEARFSRFEPGSELNHLNQSGGAWVSLSEPMTRMLAACQQAYARSQGLVNAAVLPALVAAGYSRRFAAGLEVPTDFRPQPVLPLQDILELDMDARRARLKPGCGLDFGGIAKGQLADELAEQLGENVLCNLGGDLRARGAGLGDGWQVGLPNGRTVALRDAALGTSGTTRRRWGTSFHHLIDPRTGAPSRTDVALVSVAAPDALSAEIYAKTALFLGAREGKRFLEARGLFHLLLPDGARHDS
jgi:thiamine biosynthesis lipoprotein